MNIGELTSEIEIYQEAAFSLVSRRMVVFGFISHVILHDIKEILVIPSIAVFRV